MGLVKTVSQLSKVNDKTALIVQIGGGNYLVYVGTTVEALNRVFPDKPIYAWTTSGWTRVAK